MRLKTTKILTEVFFALLGSTIVLMALFSFQLGIDPHQGWGPNRFLLLSLGAFFISLSFLVLFAPTVGKFLKKAVFLKKIRLIRWLAFPIIWLSKPLEDKNISLKEINKKSEYTIWYAIFGAAFSIFITWFYLTSGKFSTWNHSTDYFDKLANAFLVGSMALLEEPPEKLVELEDPYQINNREGIGGYIWDASLYDGKYYFYWGPVPALMAAGVKLIRSSWVVEDQYLIFFSNSGLTIILAGLIYHLKKRYYPSLPNWAVAGFIMVGALNTPQFWLINHPAVHEVPIAVGQLFLIGGIFTALIGLGSKKWIFLFLLLTGFLWGAAIGSRVNLTLGISWMTLVMCMFFIFKEKSRWQVGWSIISIIFPLLLCGAGLGWYNFERFGNIFESGHRYQLTGGAMPGNYGDIISLDYVLPNLFNLLIRPFDILWDEFPFFFTPFLRSESWPRLVFFAGNKNYFYDEPIAGIFLSTPIYWFFFIYPLRYLQLFWNWLHQRNGETTSKRGPSVSHWYSMMIIGAIIATVLFLSLFIYSTMRYEADFSALLTIITVMSTGLISYKLRNRPRLLRFILIIEFILILASILISLLTNFQNMDWIFKNNNPKLYESIRFFFSPQ